MPKQFEMTVVSTRKEGAHSYGSCNDHVGNDSSWTNALLFSARENDAVSKDDPSVPDLESGMAAIRSGTAVTSTVYNGVNRRALKPMVTIVFGLLVAVYLLVYGLLIMYDVDGGAQLKYVSTQLVNDASSFSQVRRCWGCGEADTVSEEVTGFTGKKSELDQRGPELIACGQVIKDYKRDHPDQFTCNKTRCAYHGWEEKQETTILGKFVNETFGCVNPLSLPYRRQRKTMSHRRFMAEFIELKLNMQHFKGEASFNPTDPSSRRTACCATFQNESHTPCSSFNGTRANCNSLPRSKDRSDAEWDPDKTGTFLSITLYLPEASKLRDLAVACCRPPARSL